jgi:ribosomal protein S18 acetylase RimI-like enzyme
MYTYATSETRNKTLLAKFFALDPALYAYLLGDLDPFFFENTRWWVAQKNARADSPIEAALLNYNAFSTPDLIGLAENDAQAALWRMALAKLPTQAHVHYRKQHEPIITGTGKVKPIGTHFRMVWRPNQEQDNLGSHKEAQVDYGEVVALSAGDIKRIRELHQCAAPVSYFDERLLETGLCFGIFRGDQLVAFSGCHVYSREYSIAALGAIATHPQFRSQGLGAKVTARALDELQKTIDCICLNVHSENIPALKIYKRLGFQVHCEYEEAILTVS